MECKNEHLYFLVESLRRSNMKATEIHNIVENAWPEQCPSLRHIQRLCKEFGEGRRDSFARKEGQGRPHSDKREESIEAVSQLISADESVSLRHISQVLDLPLTMVSRIMKEDLQRIWMPTRWVPHTLTEQNKVVRVERC